MPARGQPASGVSSGARADDEQPDRNRGVQPRERRSARALVVSALGPATIAVGVVWALLQPWRITLLHPNGQGFWWLLAEPPLLVVLAGAVFALVVAPGLLADLDDR